MKKTVKLQITLEKLKTLSDTDKASAVGGLLPRTGIH